MRKLIVLNLLLSFLAACSNSAQKDESASDQINQSLQRGSGNGEYYTGKLEPGTYARNIPDTQCGTKTIGEIIVTDRQILSREVDLRTCQKSESVINLNSLDYASYANSRLGLIEGLYVKTKPVVDGNAEEVWCRASNDSEKGFDLVIKADYAKNDFEAYVITDQQAHKPIKVNRDIDMFERARYKGGGNFVLDVRTNDPAQWSGTMIGDLKYEKSDYRLYCRLGGQLDRKSSLKPF